MKATNRFLATLAMAALVACGSTPSSTTKETDQNVHNGDPLDLADLAQIQNEPTIRNLPGVETVGFGICDLDWAEVALGGQSRGQEVLGIRVTIENNRPDSLQSIATSAKLFGSTLTAHQENSSEVAGQMFACFVLEPEDGQAIQPSARVGN